MAGTNSRRGGKAGPISGINVTPMVDVMLVLLVIMMVSAVYIVSQTLKVTLPKTANSDAPAESPFAVTITKEGRYLIEQKPIEESGLVAKMKQAKQSTKDPSLVVTADKEAFHGDVVHVIDLAKSEGITKFAINVEREN
jgi:biopolymer transport protein ExbD